MYYAIGSHSTPPPPDPKDLYKRTSKSNSTTTKKSPLGTSASDNFLAKPPKKDQEITRTNSITTLHSDGNENSNYKLVKMNSRNSLDSKFNYKTQYKIQLTLSPREIDLIRYSWNKILLDEPLVDKKQARKMGGNAAISTNTQNNNQNHYVTFTNTSTVASSLFCRQFYGNLLLSSPDLEKMYPSINHQAVAFAGIMSMVISQLENLESIEDYLIKLGKRHARILNIEGCHFALMGEALIQTFQERFGIHFNQELEMLWIKLYLYLANSLLQFGMDPVIKLGNDYEEEEDSFSPFSFLRKTNTRSTVTSRETAATSAMNSPSTLPSTDSLDNLSSLFPVKSKRKSSLASSAMRLVGRRDSTTSDPFDSPPLSNVPTKTSRRKKDCIIM